MPVRDYRAYANTPNGKAARARAHERYVAKRREQTSKTWKPVAKPLLAVINNWTRP